MGFLSGLVSDITSPVASLIGTGASVLGGVLSNSAAASSAQNQMNFQADMSGTAYQRAVADMKKAGLNPALAYSQGGASSPMGASYHPVNALAPASSAASQAAQLSNVQANTAVAKQQALKLSADTANVQANTALVKANTARSIVEMNTKTPLSTFNKNHPLLSEWLSGAGELMGGANTAASSVSNVRSAVRRLPDRSGTRIYIPHVP